MTLAEILYFLVQFVIILGNLITFAIIGRVLISWFSMGRRPTGQLSAFVYHLTDPIMNVVKIIPHKIGMIDLSPLIALIGVDLLVRALIYMISNIPL